MQSTFIDITSHLQLCSVKFPVYCIIVQAESKLTNGFVAPISKLPILFFLLEHGKWSIACLL